MKASELLRQAKKNHLDKISFICIAVQDAAYDAYCLSSVDHTECLQAEDRILSLIEERLEGCYTLEEWLQVRAGVPFHQVTHKRLMAHRHAWVDLLIAEFEAKGD